MVEADFFAALSSPAAITALAASRIYPVVVPEESDLPAIDYSLIAGTTAPTFDTSGTGKYRFEVNCWAETYAAAVTLRCAVVKALDGLRTGSIYIRLIGPHDFFEHDLLQYRAMVEFYVFFSI